MTNLRRGRLGEVGVQTDTRTDFAKLIGVAHSTVLFFLLEFAYLLHLRSKQLERHGS